MNGTGSVAVVATGGTPPYNYLWLGLNVTGSQQYGLPVGNYTVQVTDANGCVADAVVTVSPAYAGIAFIFILLLFLTFK